MKQEPATAARHTAPPGRQVGSESPGFSRGEEVNFPGSTLRVSGTRVRPLGEDTAVVHCRWSITGQTGPDGSPVGRRSGVFTFVVQRRPEGWFAVAAHNTDRVFGAETHVAHGDGLSPTDYRV